ncbi:MAG: TonB-dependent receptor domain-containing protein, partial [Chitinophagales bacterium]
YGAEIIINKVKSEGTNQNISTLENAKGATRYPDALWSSYALYVSDKINFSEKIQLQAGFRYNHFILNAVFDTTFYPIPFTEAKISNGAATGSIGFLYKPTNKWAIGINAATAFRAPNVDDAGKVFDSEPGAVVVPNVDLKAEYAYNVDVNLVKIFANRLKVDFSAYYTHLTNALVRRNFQLNGQDSILYDGELSQVQAIQNAAKAKVYGIQAGIELKIYKGLSLQSQINWQKGDEEQNDGSISASRHAAPLFGQTKFMYKNKALLLAMSIIYNGERTYEDLPIGEQAKSYLYAKDENNNPYSPRWYTLNFVGQYRFEKGISINLGIENLTDRRYRPYSSGLAGAGRNIVMSIRADF